MQSEWKYRLFWNKLKWFYHYVTYSENTKQQNTWYIFSTVIYVDMNNANTWQVVASQLLIANSNFSQYLMLQVDIGNVYRPPEMLIALNVIKITFIPTNIYRQMAWVTVYSYMTLRQKCYFFKWGVCFPMLILLYSQLY